MKLKIFNQKNKLTSEQKREIRKDRVLIILSGILIGISFTPFPMPFPLFLFFAFIPYFFVLEKRNTLLKINQGNYLLVFVLSIVTIYWVGSWQSKADPFLMMGGGVLIFFYPVVFFIPSTLYYLSSKIFKGKFILWLFPLFWVTAEFLLTLTDLKFPWLTLGHGLAKFTAFIQIADITGAFGLSLIVLYINIFLFKAAKIISAGSRKFIPQISLAILLFIIPVIYGTVKLNNYKESVNKIRVGVIQPNIDPWDKWEVGGLNDLVKLYFELSQKCIDQGADIILWPETALPVYLLSDSYQSTVDTIYSFLKMNNVHLMTGMPDIKFYFNKDEAPENSKFAMDAEYYYTTYNAILLFSPDETEVQRYGKMHLVPLGEKTPFVDQIPFLGNLLKWGVGISGWNTGQDTTVFTANINSRAVKIGGLVCFESVFPVFATHFVERNAQFLVVVTNDSWYGNSSGPYQHKEFAALRAVENRRAVVRSANGGISCLIDQRGITIKETEMFTRDNLVVDVSLNDEKTFYTQNPFIFPVLCSVFSLWIFGMNILLWMKKKFKL
ncbi:MAG: apolipoprotein N-acyltransferase [Ignavibacteriaceae bacterium]